MTAKIRLDLTPDEIEAAADLAKRRGFPDLTAYVRQLIRDDVSEHDEAFDGEADDDPAERLRQAWRDMKAGRVMTREEFRRRMSSDAVISSPFTRNRIAMTFRINRF